MSDDQLFFNMSDETEGVLRVLAPGAATRIFVGENSMLSFVSFEPFAVGPIHSHPEEQWGVLLEGSGVRTQDGVEHEVTAGDFWLTPGGRPHGFRAGGEGAKILDVFSPPREDYRKPR